ncbi:MAG: hypothetical protein M3R14_11780, partial [Acidobacteriota bacterium]|nr:hypothetical protein [Acidobacteriota bacterium]
GISIVNPPANTNIIINAAKYFFIIFFYSSRIYFYVAKTKCSAEINSNICWQLPSHSDFGRKRNSFVFV